MKRLMRRAILRSMPTVGSKSLTCAAIRTSRPEGSNVLMVVTPEAPARRFSQKAVAVLPIGVTAPRPVTTTRLARSLLGTTISYDVSAGEVRAVAGDAPVRPPDRAHIRPAGVTASGPTRVQTRTDRLHELYWLRRMCRACKRVSHPRNA